ncbi:MAG: magnesium transporter [Desulfurococcaceae archaeon]|nr:magnesium transporter [Desulfurococcaceae archaeon]
MGNVEIVERVAELLDQDKVSEALSLLDTLPQHEIVSVILRLKDEHRIKILSAMSPDRIGDELAKLPAEIISEIVAVKGLDDIARVLVKLPVDEVADFISKAPSRARVEILRLLPRDYAQLVASLMKFPAESVGGVMTTMVPVFQGDMTVGEVLDAYIQKSKQGVYESHYFIYIVDEKGILQGYTDVKTLLIKPREVKVSKCTQPVKVTIHPFADREVAAKLAIQYDLLEVPVVDLDGRFMGIVTLDDLLDVISSEYTEDLLKYAGIAEAIRGSYVVESPLKLALKRAPVLVYLYLMNAITGSIVATFENIIERLAILAAFMPMLADNSGNIGAQSSAIIIRGLVTGEIKLSKRDIAMILVKEFLTSTLMLTILAPVSFAIGFTITFIALQDIVISIRVALTVSLALITSCYVADIVGSAFPILLVKLHVDPAMASAPVITTIADITTVTVYFTIATLLFEIY